MTDTIQDYLRAIYQLQEKDQSISTTGLAKVLHVAPATVTAMLKRLAQMDLVVYKPYQHVELTDSGLRAALQVIRFHRLAEVYMVDVLEVPWDRVHEEAHKWEHVLSEDIAARLERVLGYPSYDPHGDPIPTADGVVPQDTGLSLTELKAGQRAVITRILEETPALLQYLGELRIFPRVVVEVVAVAPFQGPLTLRIDGSEKIIGFNAAVQVYVTLME